MHRISGRLLLALNVLWFAAWPASPPLRAETLPEYPAAKRALLTLLLTPVDRALKMDGIPTEASDSGSVLLSERIITVDEQGRRVFLRQMAYKTLSDAGVSENSEEVISFRKVEQKAYLLTAETIQPDGTRQPVKADAVLIQSPQRQAEYSLYDDQAEIKVIFPNVKPGSITHLIVVIEDQIAKMPGEFSSSYTWGGEWAAGLLRYRVDLPEAMAARLKIETMGTGIPAVVREKGPGGRVSYTWATNRQPGKRYEIGSPPERQIGPVVNLSTVRSWGDIGRWYRGLLEGHGKLSESLARQADAWTAQARDPAAITAILHSKVADQVRYVGLEFGAADYQPHSCNDVWENQYGDCKDKANLLVALLRHYGIEACIALVNTEHLGLVDRRTPDFRVFNHAVVAIRQKDASYLFCDPTIAYSEPGMLGPGSADREVLVITEKDAEWVHTPALSAGNLTYQFDLKLAENGELSGWLMFNAEGYYAASERSHFARLDANDARSEMSKVVRGFYQGAEIVDVARSDTPAPAPYVIKAYFIVPGQERAAGDGSYPLKFPSSPALFSDFGDRAERKTTFFMYRDKVRAQVSLALPAGLRPARVPPPFHFDAAAVSTDAQWKFTADSCHTDLQIEVRQTALRAEDFRPVYQSFQALRAWLGQPVVLSAGAAAQTDRKSPDPAIDLPMMASGDGQIDLVDKRYPEEGNQEMRRLALERTLQYFPDDKLTVFRAGVRLAIVDWNADRNQAALDRLNALLAGYAGQVKPDVFGWAEMMKGLALRDLKRPAEALALLERVARNKEYSDSRRSESAVNFADLAMKESPARALALLLETAALPDGASTAVEVRIAHFLLLADQPGELRQHLTKLLGSRPDSAEAQLTAILEGAVRWKLDGDDRRMQLLAETIEALCPKAGEPLTQANQACRLEAAMRRIHEKLLGLLRVKPLADWYTAEENGRKTSLADFQKVIDEASAKSDPGRALRLRLQALATHGTEEDFPERLWQAANCAEWVERSVGRGIDEAVCTQLLDLCDLLPAGQTYYYEGRFLQARRLVRDGHRLAEQKMLREIIDSPTLPNTFLAPGCLKLGASLEVTGKYPEALGIYKLSEPVAHNYSAATNCLWRAVLINLHLGNDNEAIRLTNLLEQTSAETLKAAAAEAQIRELVSLVQSGRAAEFWRATRQWWPEWIQLAGTIGVPDDARETIVPEITSLTELGASVAHDRKAGDTKAYLRHLATLISAARWQPSLAFEVASLGPATVQLVPGHDSNFRRLLISVLATPHPPGIAGLRERQLYLAANYFDEHRPKDALRIVAEFASVTQPNDKLTRAMNRMRALTALELGQDFAPSAAALEADLADPKAGPQRSMSVGLLADLYHRLKREPDEEQLLKRELENPTILDDSSEKAALGSRYDQLMGSHVFAAKVDAWIKSLALSWYDYAEPKSLDDPRLQNIEEVLKFPDKYFVAPEQLKLLLLAAQDLRRPLNARQQSLREAIRRLEYLAPDYAQMQAVAASVVANSEFDEETRLQALWGVLAYLAGESRQTEYDTWRKNPLCARFNESMQKQLASLDLEAAVERTSALAVTNLAGTMATREMPSFDVLVMNDLLGLLLRLGEIPAAEKLAAAVPSWKFAAGTASGSEATQLEYARRIRLAKSTHALHEALATAVLERFHALPESLPVEFRDLRIETKLPLLERGVTFQACLYLIKTRQFNRADFTFWQTFLESLPRNADTEATVGALCHSAIAATTDDEVRSEVINLFTSYVDMDDPGLRHRVEAEFTAYRRPVECPLSYVSIRFHEIGLAQRLGETIDPETAFADLSDPRARFVQQLSSIRVYTRTGDRAALKRVLGSLNAALLVNPYWITRTIPAMQLLGMDTELRLARDVAKRELHKAVLEAWTKRDEADGKHALELAELLGDPAALPAAWVAAVNSGPGNPLFQRRAVMTKAWLAGDWAEVAAQTTLIIRDYPTHYHFFWNRGMALRKLGKDREAAEALATYTNYARDELEYPEALELLKKLVAHLPVKP